MKKIDVGQTAAILANVGVLVGILLLVYELNQNRQMMRAQTRNDLASTVVDLALSDSMDVSRASILRKGLSGEELTEDERWILERRQNAWFRYWENVHYQFRVGMYDNTEFAVQLKAIERILGAQPTAVAYWCTYRESFSPEFVSEINDLLSTYQCD